METIGDSPGEHARLNFEGESEEWLILVMNVKVILNYLCRVS